MVDAIQAVGLEAVAQGASGAGANSPVAAAYEVGQFSQAMDRAGTSSAAAANAPQGVASTGASEPSEGMRMVMSAMDNLNGGASSIQDLAKTMTQNSGELTPGQVIEMTMKSHHFLFQCEMTSNVANRTSDGIQQLFRQQS
ncbi:MAG: hypothetical protein ACTIJY_08460 [Luteimonas sp.]